MRACTVGKGIRSTERLNDSIALPSSGAASSIIMFVQMHSADLSDVCTDAADLCDHTLTRMRPSLSVREKNN